MRARTPGADLRLDGMKRCKQEGPRLPPERSSPTSRARAEPSRAAAAWSRDPQHHGRPIPGTTRRALIRRDASTDAGEKVNLEKLRRRLQARRGELHEEIEILLSALGLSTPRVPTE